MSEARQTQIMENEIDRTTNAQKTITYPHSETHAGKRFYVQYSVASLGAMTTPDDMITLTFKTPDTTTWSHFAFVASGTSGWRARFIEGKTGGGITATGTKPVLNHDRNSSNISIITNVAGTAEVVDYDATLFTGGTTLWDDYIQGSTSGQTGDGISSNRDELILKQNTFYQVSLYGTDTEPGTLYIDWYEHNNKE